MDAPPSPRRPALALMVSSGRQGKICTFCVAQPSETVASAGIYSLVLLALSTQGLKSLIPHPHYLVMKITYILSRSLQLILGCLLVYVQLSDRGDLCKLL